MFLLNCNRSSFNITSCEYPGSFPSIFWKQQNQATTVNGRQGMRWDPLMIRWCLYLRHLSSSAYEMIRSCHVLSLPSQRTLRDYTYYTTAKPGFSGTCKCTFVYIFTMLNRLTCVHVHAFYNTLGVVYCTHAILLTFIFFVHVYAADVDQQLMTIAKINSCPEHERYVIILMDEMHIKSDLVYDKHSGKLCMYSAGVPVLL